MEKPDFGKKLIETREAKGLTQAEVAEMCKIATRTIQRIETGVVKPRAFTIKLISETLGFDFFETSYTGNDVKNDNQDSNSENHNFLWYLKDLFNLKTNAMSKLFILTVILSLGSFGIISLTRTGAQNVQQPTDNVEKIEKSTTNKVPQDEKNVLLQNLNDTYNEIDFIVISKNENDEKVEEEIRLFVEMIKNKFLPKIPIIFDTEAIKMDMSKYSFMVYGTIKNNVFLQKFNDNMPIQISNSSIIADKEYITQEGKAIFNITNPINEKEYIIVYTAQKPEGIIDINNVFHGPTNYIVFENRDNVYTKGFFINENNRWICK
jgi:transcriptional regulator with XRE-family HTH domain